MAQLNPNFEIDFDDINSYEQIQLINDTQLAKENLLMHKAYKEPAEDEIIRNQFSSFTFVDFCPKLFNASAKTDGSSSASNSNQHQYVLETFSDLFDRINLWLRVNRDWRVVSMETLIFDCATQFNHLKSSLHASNLARNMRGLRLYLSPTKSRFSGPQKIGCINVIPHRLSSTSSIGDVTEYETLDQILARLNELLLTRPIEGRILSVETITLPIVNGYVNTETNYFMDNRLDALSQQIYSHAYVSAQSPTTTRAKSSLERLAGSASTGGSKANQATSDKRHESHTVSSSDIDHNNGNLIHPTGLIDTLRVYYEFGPIVCGLVNLVDFLPRFNLRNAPILTSALLNQTGQSAGDCDSNDESDCPNGAKLDVDDGAEGSVPGEAHQRLEIDSTESLTRLIGRSLNWFAAERKRVLVESIKLAAQSENATQDTDSQDDDSTTSASSDSELERPTKARRLSPIVPKNPKRRHQVNLKVCNIQISSKVLLKSCLAKLTPQNVLDVVQSRQMIHETPKEPIVCSPCGLSSATHEIHEWCSHLLDLNQAFELSFVRLAYVIPVFGADFTSRLTRSLRSLPSFKPDKPKVGDEILASGLHGQTDQSGLTKKDIGSVVGTEKELMNGDTEKHPDHDNDDGDVEDEENENEDEDEAEAEAEDEDEESEEILSDILEAHQSSQQWAKEVSLEIVNETNRRHKRNELLNQLHDDSTTAPTSPVAASSSSPELPGHLIDQLTYRLFAPCQLVNSSSCFSINPVNSSNPLARRGSVISEKDSYSDSNTPSTLLIPTGGNASGSMCDSHSASTLTINSVHQQQPTQQQPPISFGSFFPAFPSHETLLGVHHNNQKLINHQQANKGSNSYRFATNEFEPVDAIRRRMEVYVTTNSMKVLAGETLVVNLSDHLSCLSNAIEQTLVKASFSLGRKPSTWVSVYVLYAAVDEPHLPSQLLEQQKMRERLDLISEQYEDRLGEISELDEDADEEENNNGLSVKGNPAGRDNEERDRKEEAAADKEVEQKPDATISKSGSAARDKQDAVPVFDDDFKCELPPSQPAVTDQSGFPTTGRKQRLDSCVPLLYQHRASLTPATAAAASALVSFNLKNGNIRVESSVPIGRDDNNLNHNPSDLPPYNSAYDRTVALPTRPDDHLTNYLEPVDLNFAGSWASQQSQLGAGNVWLGGNDLNKVCLYQLSSSAIRDASKSMRIRQQQQLLSKDIGGELSGLTPNSRKTKRSRKLRKRPGEHSQCSLM